MSGRRRKMYALRDEIGLTRAELIELCEIILYRDIASTEDLDDMDVIVMLAALEGYGKISHMIRTR
jgi:hypothetical protein